MRGGLDDGFLVLMSVLVLVSVVVCLWFGFALRCLFVCFHFTWFRSGLLWVGLGRVGPGRVGLLGLVWFGLVWFGSVRFSLVWFGSHSQLHLALPPSSPDSVGPSLTITGDHS